MKQVNFINATPHEINLNDGRKFAPSGVVIRVSSKTTEFDENGIARTLWGEIEAISLDDFKSKNPTPTLLPVPEGDEETIIIVSGIVASRANNPYYVSPATGHKDCQRTPDGKSIISVPGFVC
ncbi:MAG: hypothetical protein WCR33_01205 [Bacilli bacterium]